MSAGLRSAMLIALLSLVVLGCGQTGPLTLPAEPVDEEESGDEENER